MPPAPATAPRLADLAHVDAWIFDLDNTLYPPACDLFALIDERMTGYIMRLLGLAFDEARALQKGWFRTHGTTLAGLMRDHQVDPDDFLDHVHDIALDRLTPDAALNTALARLPGRRLIYTNGDGAYAQRVVDALGLRGVFECVHDIRACAYVPKPDPKGYAALCESHGVDPARAIFFEDMARNLLPAKALGMTTVWLNNGSEWGRPPPAQVGGSPDGFIDYETPALAPFLTGLFRD